MRFSTVDLAPAQGDRSSAWTKLYALYMRRAAVSRQFPTLDPPPSFGRKRARRFGIRCGSATSVDLWRPPSGGLRLTRRVLFRSRRAAGFLRSHALLRPLLKNVAVDSGQAVLPTQGSFGFADTPTKEMTWKTDTVSRGPGSGSFSTTVDPNERGTQVGRALQALDRSG